MKVVVVGATGRCGSHATRACIDNERITKVVVITRRPPAEDIASNSKVEVIIHEDFSSWPDEIMKKLGGVEACLWAVGGRVNQLNHDKVYCRKVNVEFTQSFAKALATHIAPSLPEGKKLRFIFCSGAFSEWDQNKKLLFLSDSRKIKGEIEMRLCEIAEAEDRFETFILRPTELQDEDTGMLRKMYTRPLGFSIETAEVGQAMVRIALDGSSKHILENAEIIKGWAKRDPRVDDFLVLCCK